MPTRKLLSEAQRSRLSALPGIGFRELARHHTLSEADLLYVSTRRGAATASVSPCSSVFSATRADP